MAIARSEAAEQRGLRRNGVRAHPLGPFRRRCVMTDLMVVRQPTPFPSPALRRFTNFVGTFSVDTEVSHRRQRLPRQQTHFVRTIARACAIRHPVPLVRCDMDRNGLCALHPRRRQRIAHTDRAGRRAHGVVTRRARSASTASLRLLHDVVRFGSGYLIAMTEPASPIALRSRSLWSTWMHRCS